MIARADGSVLYNFAVAIDDLDAEITHVVRGDDHLSNTPKQLLVLEALGRRAAAVRAPAAAARPRRQQALQAPRRRLGPGAARRRLPARGGRQLHRAARRRLRRRRGVLHAAGARRPVPPGAGLQEPGRVRRAQAAHLDGDHLRALEHRRADPAPGDLHRPHRPAGRGRDLTGEDPDAGGLLAAGVVPVRRPGRRPRGVRPGDRPRRRAPTTLREARDGAGGRRAVRRRPRSRQRCAASSSAADVKPGKVFQPVRVAIAGQTVSPGIFESRRAARARRDAGADRRALASRWR